ncbi:hypothetical protein NUU61_005726 [Penicillium alfredii]|uniref:Uncharacterized protein n=1 Tax=Penicillium alfredii TaxID=1506179 RepID=A0A9W9FA79_9EURO|nr:uncharacterized protein NUU61_005726 [Penicillium alfredii]KAJ5096370.1 hypothetical protein NUU61_005726 [Penicillium alfredii]
MALVRDPFFWKRFSAAVHLDEEANGGQAGPKPQVTAPTSDKESWLSRQQQKRRRSFVYGFVILCCVVFVIIGAVVVWWLSQHNWLQNAVLPPEYLAWTYRNGDNAIPRFPQESHLVDVAGLRSAAME